MGCGEISITVNFHKGKVFEVFSFMEKAGSCSNSQSEALCRAISVGLQTGVPLIEFVEHLQGIRCCSPNLFPPNEKNLSCADAICNVLRKYLPKADQDAAQELRDKALAKLKHQEIVKDE